MFGILAGYVNVTIALSCITFLGYIFAASNAVTKEAADGMAKFLLWISLPSLLFSGIAFVDAAKLDFNFLFLFVGACLMTYIFVFLVTLIFRWNGSMGSMLRLAGVMAPIGSFPSTIFIGIPLVEKLFPARPEFLVYSLLLFFLNFVIQVPISFISIDFSKAWASRSSFSFFRLVVVVLCRQAVNPIILPPVLGLIVSFNKIDVPDAVQLFTKLLGVPASPIALFLIGHTMFHTKLTNSDWKWCTFLIVTKQVLLPIVTLLLMLTRYSSSSDLVQVAFLLAALPAAQALYAVSKYAKVGSDVLSVTVFMGMLFAIPLFFYYIPLLDTGVGDLFTMRPTSQHDLDVVRAVLSLNGGVGMAGALFLLFSAVMFPTYMLRYPRRLVFWLAFHVFFCTLFFWMGTVVGYQHLTPDNSSTITVACYIQASGIQIFISTTLVWFFAVAFDLYISNIHRVPRSRCVKYERYYHASSLGFAFSSWLIAFFTGSLGPAGPWCWISRSTFQFMLYYGEVMLLGMFGIYCALRVVHTFNQTEKTWRSSRFMRDGSNPTNQNQAPKNRHRRLVGFIYAFMSVWVFGTTNRLLQSASGETTFFFFLSHVFFVSVQGFLLFLIWGLHFKLRLLYRDRLIHWWTLFKARTAPVVAYFMDPLKQRPDDGISNDAAAGGGSMKAPLLEGEIDDAPDPHAGSSQHTVSMGGTATSNVGSLARVVDDSDDEDFQMAPEEGTEMEHVYPARSVDSTVL
jgi:predicted permease